MISNKRTQVARARNTAVMRTVIVEVNMFLSEILVRAILANTVVTQHVKSRSQTCQRMVPAAQIITTGFAAAKQVMENAAPSTDFVQSCLFFQILHCMLLSSVMLTSVVFQAATQRTTVVRASAVRPPSTDC